jgi:hypothetical protein
MADFLLPPVAFTFRHIRDDDIYSTGQPESGLCLCPAARNEHASVSWPYAVMKVSYIYALVKKPKFLRGAAHGQREARHPPRDGPDHQGPLLPLPDDEGVPRGPEGRVGHPRPPRRDRGREGARPRGPAPGRGLRRRRLQRGLPHERPPLQGPLGRPHPEDGLLGGPLGPLRHLREPVHRERLAPPPADLRAPHPRGRVVPLPGVQDPVVQPRLRDRPLQPRGEPGATRRSRTPASTSASPWRRSPNGVPGLDHHALDPPLEHRAGGRARRSPTSRSGGPGGRRARAPLSWRKTSSTSSRRRSRSSPR